MYEASRVSYPCLHAFVLINVFIFSEYIKVNTKCMYIAIRVIFSLCVPINF